jgi:probable phosphoglycerate mutase
MNIYLLRHGESLANSQNMFAGARIDTPLAQEGIMQARKQARYFELTRLDRIYSSPLSRAYQTAKLINEYQNLDIVTSDLLQEVDFGVFSGLGYENNMVDFRRIIANWDTGDCTRCFENGDSYDDVLKRVIQFKEQEIDSCQECESILVVGHSTFFRFLMKSLLKTDSSNNTRNLHMKRGHLSLIVKRQSGYELEMHNYLHDG